jgi:uncharacterized repeat protein (TIGR02543 family)
MENAYMITRKFIRGILLYSAFLLLSTNAFAQTTYVVTSTADSGPGTLREAIGLANASSTKDLIHFSIGSGIQTIQLSSSLPAIINPVVLNATTQPGFVAGSPLIVIDGGGLEINGFTLAGASSGSEILGFVLGGFGSGNGVNGIAVFAQSTGNHVIKGNHVGIDAGGGNAFGNNFGIVLENSPSNQIGGTSIADRNIIAGNSSTGLWLDKSGSTNNKVEGNFLGTNKAGTAAVSNGNNIVVSNSSNNMIGGTANGSRNLISGAINPSNKQGIGIIISGTGATNNSVFRNYIGTDITGSSSIRNGFAGIYIAGGATGNKIGAAGHGNLISGNYDPAFNDYSGVGIQMEGVGTDNNIVQGNKIGTNAAGNAALPNRSGMDLQAGPSSIVIGGSNPGEGNLLSGNLNSGIEIGNPSFNNPNSSSNHIIRGNLIGTNADGIAAVPNNRGITLSNSLNNDIGGTTESSRNIISGNSFFGISIEGGSKDNKIRGNFIGLDRNGAALGNGGGTSGAGVRISGSGTSNNFIGGSQQGERNIISGNVPYGVEIISGASENLVSGNYIGTNVTGTAAIPNNTGISIFNATTNKIGDETPSAGNLISGNSANGLAIEGTAGTGNIAKGNLIGTDVNGTSALPNNAGILISSSSNIVGGDNTSARNIISGNSANGINIIGSSATSNQIIGNYIGTNNNGTAAIPNNRGINFSGANANIIGGASESARNIISGNRNESIYLFNSDNNSFFGNYIGTQSDGTSPLPNASGIFIINGSDENIVGGLQPGQANTIAFNTSRSIWVERVPVLSNAIDPLKNSISGNRIFANNSIGIDLGSTGPTANDPDDADSGPNNLQNFPVISGEPGYNGGVINLSYSVPSSPSYSAYPIRVEFFIADGNMDDSKRQGKEFLYAELFTEADFSAGALKAISFSLPAGSTFSAGDKILATATDAQGNTSEFGIGVVVQELIPEYTLSVSVVGSGSVLRDPEGPVYEEGTSVKLTAVAASGWEFTGWSGAASGSSTETNVLMDGDKSVTATFAEIVSSDTQGCTPGFWKNSKNWCSNYKQNHSFFKAFGITNTRNIGGKNGKLSMLDALDLNGGGYYKLARHATAALLNACNNGVNYSYSTEDIINAVREVFNNEKLNSDDAETLGDLYDIANNAGCPLSNSNSNSLIASKTVEEIHERIVAYPNPISGDGLWLNFPSVDKEVSYTASLYDIRGRLLLTKTFEVEEVGRKVLWSFDHSDWNSGVYLLLIRTDKNVYQLRIMK